jgi:hypothetical protein
MTTTCKSRASTNAHNVIITMRWPEEVLVHCCYQLLSIACFNAPCNSTTI